jgi:hypothetical protein
MHGRVCDQERDVYGFLKGFGRGVVVLCALHALDREDNIVAPAKAPDINVAPGAGSEFESVFDGVVRSAAA